MDLQRYFVELARYHEWATRRLFDQNLAALSDEHWYCDTSLFFRSIHGTLNHLLVTDNTWHARFAEGLSPRTPLDAQLHADRDALCEALIAAVGRWAPWIESLDTSRFEGELVYTRNNGQTVRVPYAAALGHVFNHATHHRGQISAGLTAMGLAGPELDWVYKLQQEVKPS